LSDIDEKLRRSRSLVVLGKFGDQRIATRLDGEDPSASSKGRIKICPSTFYIEMSQKTHLRLKKEIEMSFVKKDRSITHIASSKQEREHADRKRHPSVCFL
jgi:hypothetical protein